MSFNEPIYGMELIHFDVVFASLHFSSSSHLIRLSHYRIVWRILKRVEVRREKKGGGNETNDSANDGLLCSFIAGT